jgi:uncharacterized secreted protein with C-terminal beta-propeller domain
MRKLTALAITLLVLATACSDDDAATTTTALNTGSGIDAVAAGFDPEAIQFTASLRRFDACADVLAHFKAEALARVGPYGLEGGGGFFPIPFGFDDMAVEESIAIAGDSAAPATTAAGAAREGVDFSGTNVQVAGVDEPDMVKTDGSRILAVVDTRLSYVDVSTGTARLLDSLQLPGWDHRFFMTEDRAIVFARGDGFIIMPVDAAEDRIAPAYGGPTTLVMEVDLSDPENLSVTRTLRIDGNYLSARSVDGVARMVVSSYPNELPFVYPSNQAAEDFALEANKQVIENSTIDDWLPNYTLISGTEGDLIASGLLIDCGGVHAPAEFAGFNTLSVVGIDAAEGLAAPDGSAVISQGETIYASTESLYVATNVWVPNDVWGTPEARTLEENYSTALHKFDLTEGSAEYRASGSVTGHLLNQFSLDEYDGFLRVATTDGPPWGFDEESESFITVLQERDGELQQVGRVGEMGRGERIFSARFIGDTAYVVTFRQTDPFYVVDLSDPEAPTVAGELKIAGYSGYLHPVGEDRILGIGQDATDEGVTTGAKATMFDVSDPANPRELGTWTMSGGYSDVEWDHLAFLYWPPEEIAVLPIQNWQTQFTGAVVLKTDDGVREIGRISHEKGGDGWGIDSDCPRLSTDEMLALDPSAQVDDGIFVFICGEGEEVYPSGDMECESVGYEDAQALAAEDGIDITPIMGEGDTLTVCFPEFVEREWTPPVLRSLVIGDRIWTLSYEALQSNAIDDLEVDQVVPLG